METKVSIIIPIYNVEKYLKQCLDSVINQTFKDIEIICINDSSTDKSLQIIKEYQQKDNRIILIDLKENKGVSNARNEGLKIAKGKYITFVDPDDWTDKDYVKTLYDNIIKYDYDIIGIGFYIFNKQIKEYKYPKFCYDTDFSLLKNKQKLLTLRLIWTLWAKIYKRDFIINNNIVFESRIMGDITFNYEAILSANNIKFIDKANYFYRVYRTNSITLNKKRFYFYPEIINKIKKILVSKNLYEQYKQSFYSYSYLLLASELEVVNLSDSEVNTILSKMKKEIFDDSTIKIKIYDNFLYKIRTYLFSFCFKYNINYNNIGKFLRKIYFLLCK